MGFSILFLPCKTKNTIKIKMDQLNIYMFNFGITPNQYSKSNINFMKHLELSIYLVGSFNI